MKQLEFIVTGIPELDKELDRLDRKVRNRVARSALAKGASIGAKAVKAEIPSLLKSVKRSIGTSVKKGKDGITIAKFGTVGKRKASFKRNKEHSAGVGISKQNAHWFFMGTAKRTQKKTGRVTGKMPSNDAVSRGAKAAMPAIKAGVTKRAKERLAKEIAKRGG
jgi:hypothetical protein